MTGAGVQRTTFFEEQARHRRRTFRFALFGFVAVALTGIPVSVIVTPVLFLVVLTLAHLINLATPIPQAFWDGLKSAGRLIPEALDPIDKGLNQQDWSHLDWLALLRLGAVLVVPGMAFMVFLWLWVRALFWHAGAGGVLLSLGARDPDQRDLEERQLVNIIHEMAIAAGIRPPAVKLLDHPEPNAAIVGSTPDDATMVVTRGLLATIDRHETQGVLAHLIGSAVNGDLGIAMLLLSVTQTFSLLTAILAAGSAKKARQALWGAMRGLVIRDDRSTQQVADLLSQEQDIDDSQGNLTGCFGAIRLPFLLAASCTSFMVSMARMLVFGPFLGALWRARRYLADATAIKLTRNPDGLAHALQRLQTTQMAFAGGASSGLLFLHWPRGSGPTGSWHPGIARRLHRLVAQGAKLREVARTGGPARRRGILGTLLLGLVTLLVWGLFAVGIAAMLVGGTLIMGITLVFVGGALFAIHGFFTVLPDLIHWIRYDSVPFFKNFWEAIRGLLSLAR